MIKEIKSIEIKGGFFHQKQVFNLFQKTTTRISLIYGKNGSGKTSISNAINDYNKSTETYETVNFLNYNKNKINIQKESIFVFNENYIDKNIKFSDSGLDAIVMFGKQKEIDDRINIITENIKKLEIQYHEKLELYSEYIYRESEKCPDFYFKKIKEKLSEKENGWARREKKIENTSRKKITMQIIDDIINTRPTISYEKAIIRFNEEIKKIDEIRNNEFKIIKPLEQLHVPKTYDQSIISLLKKKIKKGKLTEREKKIIDIMGDSNIEYIQNTQSILNKDFSTCPLCFQPILEKNKQKAINEIKKVLNENVKKHINKINEKLIFEFADITNPLNNIDFIDSNTALKIKNIYDGILEKNKKYKEKLEQKKNRVYSSIDCENYKVYESIEKINKYIKEYNIKISEYNMRINHFSELISKVKMLNKYIAYYESEQLINKYNNQQKQKDILFNEIKNLSDTISQLEHRRKEFSENIEKIRIPLKRINDDINYIFFDNNRLKLIHEDGKYKILSRGKKIPINKVSIGERNIISLCYFFASMLDKIEEGREYKNDHFIVIDDPISSFDFENKIGLLSFLSNKIDLLITANSANKIIILTHELEAMFHLQKIVSEIPNFIANNQKNKSQISESYILKNKKIEEFKNTKNDYKTLMQQVFSFAMQDDIDENDELTIGNTLRRLLESFSTFEYGKGIIEICKDEDIQKTLKKEKYIKYYKNLMYRLVLNGESHMEERIYTISDNNLYEYISKDEKIRICKDILVFMYILNPTHILKKLGLDKVKKIQEWKKNIK